MRRLTFRRHISCSLGSSLRSRINFRLNRQKITMESKTDDDVSIDEITMIASDAENTEKLKKLKLAVPLMSENDQGSVTVVERSSFLNDVRVKNLNFEFPIFFECLKTKILGQTLLYSDRVSSTQTLMLGPLKSLPVGTVFTASEQVSGKGRGSNQWKSPPGCLMFSLKCATRRAELLPFMQYLVTLCSVRAVRSKQQSLNVKIKWPNDIYGDNHKIGGVICSSTSLNGVFEVVIGTGINVSNAHPTTCLNSLAGLRPDVRFTREEYLADILTQFESAIELFEKEGFAPFLDDYLANWLHSNQKLTVADLDGRTRDVTVTGLTRHGYLKAFDDLGEVHELHPDGNRLDFFSGLISRKVV
eukprot:801348_1